MAYAIKNISLYCCLERGSEQESNFDSAQLDQMPERVNPVFSETASTFGT